MSALIDRLSKLTGPRYKMDVAIALATDFWPKDRIQSIVYNDDGDPWVYFTDGPDLPLPPAYTASVDAIIALARRLYPDVMYRVGNDGEGPDPSLYLGELFIPGEQKDSYFTGLSPVDAVSLCIALLRAKEASNVL